MEEKNKVQEEKRKSCGRCRTCRIFSVAIIALALLVGVSYWYKTKQAEITPDDAKAKVLKYIVDKGFVKKGADVTVKETTKEGALYKLVLSVQGQEIPVYVTTDGKKFFPQAMEMDETARDDGGNTQASKDVPKSDAPEVQLFVMSYCPYGTQMEKGILPVVETLGNKIKYSLKFVDYAMHGQKELDENMRQYCIEKDQGTKLDAYLKCFLQKGQGSEQDCMKSSGVDSAKVAGCVSLTDQQFKVSQQANDKSTWSNGQFPPFDINKDDNTKYGVQGSPTLVVNGVQADVQRDSASILKTICGAFNNPPAECNTQLSSAAPSPGFGSGTDSSGSAASCGN